MRVLNETTATLPLRPYMTTQDVPKTFRVGSRSVAYYPTDMELCALDDDAQPTTKSLSIPRPPDTLREAAYVSFVAFPTEECNLACSYCYLRQLGVGGARTGARHPGSLMHDRTACRALDFVAKRARRIRLCLFGGEPLLAWGKCRWIVERAEQLCALAGARPSVHMTTNGTLITPAVATFADEHGMTLIVSIDGAPDVHDRCRRYPDGRGSYTDMMRGLSIIRDTGNLSRRVTLRATFEPGETPEGFVGRLDHLNALCDDGYAEGVAVEPATGCGADCAIAGGYAPDEIVGLFRGGIGWALARARTGKRARWAHMNKTLHRLVHREMSWTECGAAKGTFGLAPDGTMHVCHHLGCEIGDVINGVDQDKLAPWIENRLHARKPCGTCWARHLCGGGCRMEGWYLSGVPERGPVGCATSKARSEAAIRIAAELADEPEALALCGSGAALTPQTRVPSCSAHACEASCQLATEGE